MTRDEFWEKVEKGELRTIYWNEPYIDNEPLTAFYEEYDSFGLSGDFFHYRMENGQNGPVLYMHVRDVV